MQYKFMQDARNTFEGKSRPQGKIIEIKCEKSQ